MNIYATFNIIITVLTPVFCSLHRKKIFPERQYSPYTISQIEDHSAITPSKKPLQSEFFTKIHQNINQCFSSNRQRKPKQIFVGISNSNSSDDMQEQRQSHKEILTQMERYPNEDRKSSLLKLCDTTKTFSSTKPNQTACRDDIMEVRISRGMNVTQIIRKMIESSSINTIVSFLKIFDSMYEGEWSVDLNALLETSIREGNVACAAYVIYKNLKFPKNKHYINLDCSKNNYLQQAILMDYECMIRLVMVSDLAPVTGIHLARAVEVGNIKVIHYLLPHFEDDYTFVDLETGNNILHYISISKKPLMLLKIFLKLGKGTTDFSMLKKQKNSINQTPVETLLRRGLIEEAIRMKFI